MALAVVERVKLESIYGLLEVAIVEGWPFVEVPWLQRSVLKIPNMK